MIYILQQDQVRYGSLAEIFKLHIEEIKIFVLDIANYEKNTLVFKLS